MRRRAASWKGAPRNAVWHFGAASAPWLVTHSCLVNARTISPTPNRMAAAWSWMDSGVGDACLRDRKKPTVPNPNVARLAQANDPLAVAAAHFRGQVSRVPTPGQNLVAGPKKRHRRAEGLLALEKLEVDHGKK